MTKCRLNHSHGLSYPPILHQTCSQILLGGPRNSLQHAVEIMELMHLPAVEIMELMHLPAARCSHHTAAATGIPPHCLL